MSGAPQAEPLHILREYRHLAPWNLRDLSVLVGAILDASSVTPINAAARASPSERTIRFYVTKGLVSPPEGRGTAATYTYRHFLQLLCIKLRQMEGVTLAAITREMQDQTGDILERRAAQTLGPGLPLPHQLSLRGAERLPRGRSGRAISTWLARDFERQTLEAVIQARNQAVSAGANAGPAAMKQVAAAENQLSAALSRFNVVVEQYPQLKATANVGQLQEELTSTENRISFARQA